MECAPYSLLVGNDGAAHYETLGVDPSASMNEIRRAYLSLARSSHPDFHTANDADRISAERRMRTINAAWVVLGDVDERSAYDRARLTGDRRRPFHASSHGAIDEADAWQPFDASSAAGFDDRDDRPITSSALPSWMKTFPALGVLFGLASLMVGSLIGLARVAELGLILLVFSFLMFLAAPLVALSMSKGEDRRP